MAYNLKDRSFVKEIDFEPGELRFLLDLSSALKSAKYADRTILGGLSYRYYVRAFDQNGRAGPPSNTVIVDVDLPDTIQALRTEASHV